MGSLIRALASPENCLYGLLTVLWVLGQAGVRCACPDCSAGLGVCRAPVEQCALVCGSDYMEDIAGALGVDAAQVLNWGKVGKQVHAFVRRGTASEDDADEKLRVCCMHSILTARYLEST